MSITLPANITRAVGRGTLAVRRFSPEILTGLGVVGTVGSTVLIARATLRLEALIDIHQANIAASKVAFETGVLDEKEYQKAITQDYTKLVLSLTKLYGPGVTLLLASIGSLIAANGILRKRNLAALAALKGVESSYAEYRKRVIEAIGADKEEEIRFGVEKQSYEENGKTKTRKVATKSIQELDQWARVFDSENKNFRRGEDINRAFLKSQQRYFNDRLVARGWIFLDEIYEELGFEVTQESRLVGWTYVEGRTDGLENRVDIGIDDQPNFLVGEQDSVWLTFNHHGSTWDKINKG